MPNVVHLNLNGAPPIQGRSVNISGHADPGLYHLRIVSLNQEPLRSNPNDEQFVVRAQIVDDPEFEGVFIVERFPIPTPAKPSTMGLSNFHAFLLECGLSIRDLEFDLDLERFVGRRIDAFLVDDVMQASGNFAERTISRVDFWKRPEGGPAAPPTQRQASAASTSTQAASAARATATNGAGATTAVAPPPQAAAPPPGPDDQGEFTADGEGIAATAEEVENLFDTP